MYCIVLCMTMTMENLDNLMCIVYVYIYIPMGSDNSKVYAQREIPEQFKQISSYPDIFQNVLTGIRLQRHLLCFSSQAELAHQKDVFIFRRMHADRFLVPHYFENTNKDTFCSQTFQICYFVELPSHPFSLQQQLEGQRAFTLLIECLKGFELLFNKFGAFNVTPKQLFFDNSNNLKVWISNNPFASRVSPNSMTEHLMVQEIFDLFDVLRDQRGSLFNFNSYLSRLRQKDVTKFTFRRVLSYMIEEASKFFTTRRTKLRNNFVDYNPSMPYGNSNQNNSNKNKNLNFEIEQNIGEKQNKIQSKCHQSASSKNKNRISIGKRINSNNNNDNNQHLQFREYLIIGSQSLTQNSVDTDKNMPVSNRKVRRYNSQESSTFEQGIIQAKLFHQRNQKQTLKSNSKATFGDHPGLRGIQTARMIRRSADHITFFYNNNSNNLNNKEGELTGRAAYEPGLESAQPSFWQYGTDLWSKNNSTRSKLGIHSKMMSVGDGPLSQLKTIKSIIDFEGIHMDQGIRRDLERMEANAQSRIA